ncbi:MAG: cell division protein FtsA [Alphaproteobacteria bacterium]|nr:cell division protein FtsA [Alphaproteobacteria bacterium]
MNKALTKPWNGVIAALDVGSTKCCCFIAQADGGGHLRVIGIGYQESKGVRGGLIVDMDAAEATIVNTVSAAEQMAGETVRHVVLNVTSGRPLSQSIHVEVEIASPEVADNDVRRALAQGRSLCDPNDRELLHFIPLGYTLDGNRGIRDPRGMFGRRLGVDMHVITADSGPVRNLATCAARGHLDIDAFVVSPYAAGLSTLVEDETDLGVTLIDLGGGSTSIAVFYDGSVIFTDSLPIGGGHVTSDVARGLSTPLPHAERLKTLYGSCLSQQSDQRDVIDVPPIGEDDPASANHVPKSILVGIIQPRIEETLELVRQRLEASGFDRVAGRRVVLTGGASQLQGLRELAQLVLDKQVRMGRPVRVTGLADAVSGPAFATCAGLLAYAHQNRAELPSQSFMRPEQTGMLGRVGSWLREHL